MIKTINSDEQPLKKIKQLLIHCAIYTVMLFPSCSVIAPHKYKEKTHYATATHTNEIMVKQLIKSTKSWDGNPLPPYPTSQPEVTILYITIPPGSELPSHYHPVINAGVLIKGELTVITKNNEKLYLKAGDSLVEVVNKTHYGKNEGTIPAEIIVFYAGTTNSPITVKTP